MKKLIVTEKYNGKKLNKFLLDNIPNLSQNLFYKTLRKKDIKINPIWNGNAESAKLNNEYWIKKELLIK